METLGIVCGSRVDEEIKEKPKDSAFNITICKLSNSFVGGKIKMALRKIKMAFFCQFYLSSYLKLKHFILRLV
ncbi:hypothetical protein [Helicobacter burdigaliensis]|uniref:hypothetical protein n=1 Tax=Helicobacter burdigaliensis TaxID=2315334 RepID=UPI000EF7240C|nr:hypothetical protein [Helicobacter burdigaliensis]